MIEEAIKMNVQEEIRRLAYDFYEKSGRMGGRELEHWLMAEQVVMSKLAAHEKAGTARPASERKQKRISAAGAEKKPRATQKKKLAAKAGEKTRKPKG
jgi:hypothetical protein